MSSAANQFESVEFWILNIEYLLLFITGRCSEKIKTNIQNLTQPNQLAAEDIVKKTSWNDEGLVSKRCNMIKKNGFES